jgi:putative hydrolase of the HAD superfamily
MTRAGLCFDATGTLIEMTASVGEVYHEVAGGFGVDLPARQLDDAFRHVMRLAPPRTADAATLKERRRFEFTWWSDRIRETFQGADVAVRFDDFGGFAEALFETYRQADRWRPRHGVEKTLGGLASAGHPMAVISNFDHRLLNILQALELEQFFIIIIVPSLCGALKPDRAPFEAASESLERPLSELLYIGDDAPDTLAAIRAQGLRTLDVRTLASFEDLPEWVMSAATLPST